MTRRCRRMSAAAAPGSPQSLSRQGAVADLADAAQGHPGSAGLEPAGERCRNGADPHRPCRRPADAGRGAEGARAADRAAAGAAPDGLRPGCRSRRATAVSAVAAGARPGGSGRRPDDAAGQPAAEPAAVAGHGAAAARGRRPTCRSSSLEDIAALAEANRDGLFKAQLKRYVRLVGVEPGRLDVSLTGDAPEDACSATSRRG